MLERDGSRVVVVIPARLDSQRLPGKMLLSETGRPLIQHTCEAAQLAELPDRVIVATDSELIADAVTQFGGTAVMTSADLQSGTDRVAEVAGQLDDTEIVVNVQGDEPEIDPHTIDGLIALVLESNSSPMATAAVPIDDWSVLHSPSCVKVVCDASGDALYFSRAPIPFPRESSNSDLSAENPQFLQHLGIYAYRREFLLSISQLPVSNAERLESLEQLRVLQAGHRIRVKVVEHAQQGIDTREEYEAFVRRIGSRLT